MKYLILLSAFSVISLSKACDILRNTQYGPICGTIKTNRGPNTSASYYYFTGVPYARPPLGSLRFKEAEPPLPWIYPKNSTVPGNICTQISSLFMGSEVLGSEDCLTLEIAVEGNHSNGLPVMVWIHGGSFLFSSHQETGPDYFMEKPIVLVSINYRLNVFGFLSTLNQDAPGDPNKVTIFGGSAGGASVQFHMLSPRSKNLFHRAISQSGVTLNTWAFQRNPKEMAFRLGRGLGFDTHNTTKLILALQQVPSDILIKTGFNSSIMGPYILFDEVPFKPSIEHGDDPNAFLSHRAYEALESGSFNKVPYMIGHTTEEGSIFYEYIVTGFININDYEENPSLFVPISMNISKNSGCINHTVKAIKQHFFKNSTFTDKVNWIKYMGQSVRSFMKSAELICKHQKEHVFYYVYSYVGTNALSYLGGAGHYSEVLKLFYPLNENWSTNLTKEDRVVQKNLLNLWTTFANTGHPTRTEENSTFNPLQWPSFCDDLQYFDIGATLSLKINPDNDFYNFWEPIFETCGTKPYNTY
ncbi:hypothetical protein FQR65_LT12623 [Abscondita terminalis]|nr:hypothetical protein FQR65_LT12623 [Abscondita terminalis]